MMAAIVIIFLDDVELSRLIARVGSVECDVWSVMCGVVLIFL